MEHRQQHVLYTVLDWGLGHATRSIPVIEELLKQHVRVSIAGNGDSMALLHAAFPDLECHYLPGLPITYPVSVPLALHFSLQFRALSEAVSAEHEATEQLVKLLQPDAIISDNRYGAWSEQVPSIFIGHQLDIQLPSLLKPGTPLLRKVNTRLLRHFQSVWVPDLPGSGNLTGKLSHGNFIDKTIHPRYIGLLSRFRNCAISDTPDRYELLIILSGPEPQRTHFESMCLKEAVKTGLKTLLVRGRPTEQITREEGNLTIVSHLDSPTLHFHLLHSRYILSRSGHTTLMDLATIGRSAICIPTPGQTEQEYLAQYLSKQGFIVYRSQDNFDLSVALAELENCKVMPSGGNELLTSAVADFLKGLPESAE